jgi:hypothetical protein
LLFFFNRAKATSGNVISIAPFFNYAYKNIRQRFGTIASPAFQESYGTESLMSSFINFKGEGPLD